MKTQAFPGGEGRLGAVAATVAPRNRVSADIPQLETRSIATVQPSFLVIGSDQPSENCEELGSLEVPSEPLRMAGVPPKQAKGMPIVVGLACPSEIHPMPRGYTGNGAGQSLRRLTVSFFSRGKSEGRLATRMAVTAMTWAPWIKSDSFALSSVSDWEWCVRRYSAMSCWTAKPGTPAASKV